MKKKINTCKFGMAVANTVCCCHNYGRSFRRLESLRIPCNPFAGQFFDYPHTGVGDNYIVVGSNQFGGAPGFEGRVWAMDKADLYAGNPVTMITASTTDLYGTPQPFIYMVLQAPGRHGVMYITSLRISTMAVQRASLALGHRQRSPCNCTSIDVCSNWVLLVASL